MINKEVIKIDPTERRGAITANDKPIEKLNRFIRVYSEKIKREYPKAPPEAIEAYLDMYRMTTINLWAREGIDPSQPMKTSRDMVNQEAKILWGFVDEVIQSSLQRYR